VVSRELPVNGLEKKDASAALAARDRKKDL